MAWAGQCRRRVNFKKIYIFAEQSDTTVEILIPTRNFYLLHSRQSQSGKAKKNIIII